MSAIKTFAQLLIAALTGTAAAGTAIADGVKVARARGDIAHYRPKHFVEIDGVKTAAYLNDDGELVPGHKWIDSPIGPIVDPSTMTLVGQDVTYNVKTNNGMDFLHIQGYGTAGLGANGLNYIALSNDALTETAASTTLSTEIAANGLTRAQGTVSHTAGTTTTTIAKTFTCATSSQAAQKASLFTAVSAGTMNHALAFTQRTLQIGDTLALTFTITLS